MGNRISIQFLGAAGTVTGSKYLVEANEMRILIDCGLFQGLKILRALNWSPLPVSPASIDAVLLTHGHLDHVGYLPRLVADGFRGSISGTVPTIDIAKIILEDSARIQEEDAHRANANGYSKHTPAKPLYNLKDVEKTLPLFVPRGTGEWIQLSNDISFRFIYNGHILGSTFIELKVFDKLLVFSGDIGRYNDPLLFPPVKPAAADVLVIESTYGNRLHAGHPEEKLDILLNEGIQKDGPVIIPGFAVERIQLLMYLTWKLRKQGKISDIPIYMDSPMGKNVLDVIHHHRSWHKLLESEIKEMCNDIRLIESADETEDVIHSQGAKIVIAGSGMASGGRVLRYFQEFLGDPSATILLAGYQAEGTRGRQLLDGAKELKLYGKYYKVKAAVRSIEGLSAHADQAGLIDWMSDLKNQPGQLFITHGEAAASAALKAKIKEVYDWDSATPVLNEKFLLS